MANRLRIYLDRKPRGEAARIARALKVSTVMLSQWANDDKPVPVERRPQLERETEGAVRCESWGRDATWLRMPDATWPWHAQGRPLLDTSEVPA